MRLDVGSRWISRVSTHCDGGPDIADIDAMMGIVSQSDQT